MPRVRVGDIEMYYAEAGAGEPLVLIMGFGGDHLAWGFQIPAFTEAYRVIAFDNRGAGRTDAPDHAYTTRMMAADTLALMDTLGVERAHVLGVSMGGMIAQEIALGHPERVRSLQLHGTFARPDAYTLAQLAAWGEVRTLLSREAALRVIALWLFARRTYGERPEFVEMLLQNALANPYPQSVTGFLRQRDAIAGHDALERLGEIRCPTLVTCAQEDILVPPALSRELAEGIAGAAFVTIAGAGHAYFWEVPETFNRTCLEFLAAQETGK